MRATWERESPEVGAGLVSKIHTIDGLRHSGMNSEHGQTMIRVLQDQSSRQDCGRWAARWILFVHSKFYTGHGEFSTWKHGQTTRTKYSLKHRQRSAFVSIDAGYEIIFAVA